MAITVEEMMDVGSRRSRGRVVRIDRLMKLSGVVATDQISAIAEVYASGQVPAAGQTIIIDNSVLYLTEDKVTMRQNNTMADVNLTYEGGGSLGGSGEIRRGGDVSVSQDRTLNDRDENELVTTHEGRDQASEMSIFQPLATPWVETIESTNDPDALASQWISYTNSSPWRGKAAGKWLVSRVKWDELNPAAATGLWVFRWAFQESALTQGWLPVIAYVDPETNRHPKGLILGEGLKYIPWYLQRDFNTKFT